MGAANIKSSVSTLPETVCGLQRQNELDAELTAIQRYFRTEREKELAAEDQARRENAKLLGKEIGNQPWGRQS